MQATLTATPAPDARTRALLLTFVAPGHRNKPQGSLYVESKMPVEVLHRVRALRSEPDYNTVIHGVAPDGGHDDEAYEALERRLDAARLPVDVRDGIPDEFKVVLCAEYVLA